MNRRWLLLMAGGVASGMLVTHFADAQSWPSRNITLVVPFPPGGTNDILARAIGDKLAAILGVPVVIDNRGGGCRHHRVDVRGACSSQRLHHHGRSYRNARGQPQSVSRPSVQYAYQHRLYRAARP